MKAWLRVSFAAALTVAVLAPPGPARAVQVFLDLPGLTGESSPPGQSGVTALDSLVLRPESFDLVKRSDGTSSALLAAAVSGTPFTSAALSYYGDADVSAPGAVLAVHDALVSSFQPTVNGSNQPADAVTFDFVSPTLSLFLELSGITGESDAPGHPGVIALGSVDLPRLGPLAFDDFTIVKQVDGTSAALEAAEIAGDRFDTASVLVYSDLANETRPDFTLVYTKALILSIVREGGHVLSPSETLAFAGAGATVTPEPGALELLASGLVAGMSLRRRGARRKVVRSMAELA